MRKSLWRQSPALVISVIALFAAMSGSVYAAKKISGKSIKVKSIPGNRIALRSIPANRLAAGALPATQITGQITGAQIEENTLGQVPLASHAETATTARSAVDAETAINAVNAVNAEKVNGFQAGCLPGTVRFAGGCWETTFRAATTAPAAAAECASAGGELPDAMTLAAFAVEPGVSLDVGGEWSGDIISYTTVDAFAVATVSASGAVGSATFHAAGVSDTRKFRCVKPLLSE